MNAVSMTKQLINNLINNQEKSNIIEKNGNLFGRIDRVAYSDPTAGCFDNKENFKLHISI